MDSLYGNLQGLRPLARGLSDGEESSVDALGFWKYAARPDSLADGWLLLGDSAAMGIGVEPDSTFAGRLAARWPGWRILNASWIGYSSAGYLNVARALLADHRTSVRQTPVIRRVTLFWTLNDVYSRVDVGGPPGQVVREHGSSVLKWVRRYCRAYAWLKRLVFDRPKVCRRDDPRFVAALGDVVGLKALCDSAGVRMEIFLLPYEFQLRQTDSASFQPQRLLSQVLDSLTIAWYDPATTLRDAPGDPGGLYRFGDGIHFSPRGHLDIFSYLEGALHPSLTRFRVRASEGFSGGRDRRAWDRSPTVSLSGWSK